MRAGALFQRRLACGGHRVDAGLAILGAFSDTIRHSSSNIVF
ncbi:MAG: hypothetical protein JWR29_2174, partial [Tardiphaga sp.]|nr:hypothetical protein [Tardiphaga sp.]